jgi:hypothetical protein
MTCIVATRTHIYADSKCSTGDTHYPTPKIFRVGDDLVGTAGNNQGIERFLAWYGGKRKRPLQRDKNDHFDCVVVTRDGIFAYGGCSFPDLVQRDFHIVGNGGKLAHAAMVAGASPRRAVEIACEISNDCGLPVQELALLPAKRKR